MPHAFSRGGATRSESKKPMIAGGNHTIISRRCQPIGLTDEESGQESDYFRICPGFFPITNYKLQITNALRVTPCRGDLAAALVGNGLRAVPFGYPVKRDDIQVVPYGIF